MGGPTVNAASGRARCRESAAAPGRPCRTGSSPSPLLAPAALASPCRASSASTPPTFGSRRSPTFSVPITTCNMWIVSRPASTSTNLPEALTYKNKKEMLARRVNYALMCSMLIAECTGFQSSLLQHPANLRHDARRRTTSSLRMAADIAREAAIAGRSYADAIAAASGGAEMFDPKNFLRVPWSKPG